MYWEWIFHLCLGRQRIDQYRACVLRCVYIADVFQASGFSRQLRFLVPKTTFVLCLCAILTSDSCVGAFGQ